MRRFLLSAGGIALALSGGTAVAQEFRIGFVSTLSGGGAIIGTHQVNGWKLGFAQEGWTKDGDKVAGVPVAIFYADDQTRPDVAVREVDKLLNQQKVQLVAGFIPSHTMMASLKPILDKGVPLVTTNAGPSPVAGEACHPLVTSTSFQNDNNPEALGKLISEDKIESLYMLAPNYQGGKDMIAGVTRTLSGPRVIGQTLFKINETDFQSDISKIRAEKPKAIFVFAPGAMGISFLKQWAASGMNTDIKVYTIFMVDWTTLPAIGDAALGTFHTMHWSPDLDFPANRKFVKDYLATFGHMPSHWSAQSYDGARLVIAALGATGGKYGDGMALARALRKTPYESTRGPYSYNVNGMPIQNYYKREVVKGSDGKLAIVSRGVVLANHKDAHWEKCPAERRL